MTPSQKRRDEWVQLLKDLRANGVPRWLRPRLERAIKEINDAGLYSRTAIVEQAVEEFRDQLPPAFIARLERFAPPPPYGPVVGGSNGN